MSHSPENLGIWVLQRIATTALLLVVLMSAVFWIVRLAPGIPWTRW